MDKQQFTVESDGDTLIVKSFKDYVTIDCGTILGDLVQSYMKMGDYNFIFDLESLNSINSALIGTLIIFRKLLKEKNKNVIIVSKKELTKYFKFLKLLDFFEIYNSLEEAEQSLKIP